MRKISEKTGNKFIDYLIKDGTVKLEDDKLNNAQDFLKEQYEKKTKEKRVSSAKNDK